LTLELNGHNYNHTDPGQGKTLSLKSNFKETIEYLERQPGALLIIASVMVMPVVLALFQGKVNQLSLSSLFAFIGGISFFLFVLCCWRKNRPKRGPARSSRPAYAMRAPLTAEGFPEGAESEGIAVDLYFEGEKPAFGDLFQICGDIHPKYPPSGRFNFKALAPYGFQQVDDYYGIKSSGQEGAEVVVWLFPLVGGEEVCHHRGPYDGVRLAFNILQNPQRCARDFTSVVSVFAQTLKTRNRYPLRDLDLGNPPDLGVIEQDILKVTQFWQSRGIKPGSAAALEIEI
jgi:hypothetical protein